MRPVLVALLLLAVLVPAAVAADRRPALLERDASQVADDGERFVTFARSPRDRDRLQVLDTATGERRSLATDPRCRPPGPFQVTAAGRALLACARGGPAEQYDLLDLRTGAITPLPRFIAADGETEPAVWIRVGRQWASGTGTATGRNLVVNWRTGEVRVFPAGIGPGYDLDDPVLHEWAACHDWDRRGDLGAYDHPYFLTGDEARSFGLLHCNGGRRVLWRGRRLEWPGIAGGRVTWVAGRRLFVYDVRTRRRTAFRVPRTRALAEWPLLVLRTDRAAILAITQTEDCDKDCWPRTSDLYVARFQRH
ncbi:MAG TPA: hypothetical protein VF533_25545 [Solirubrobacteraceae bacterium]